MLQLLSDFGKRMIHVAIIEFHAPNTVHLAPLAAETGNDGFPQVRPQSTDQLFAW